MSRSPRNDICISSDFYIQLRGSRQEETKRCRTEGAGCKALGQCAWASQRGLFKVSGLGGSGKGFGMWAFGFRVWLFTESSFGLGKNSTTDRETELRVSPTMIIMKSVS